MQHTNTKTQSSRMGHSIKGVIELLGIGRTAFYFLRQNDRFPKPCYYIGSSPRWTREVIDAWRKGAEND